MSWILKLASIAQMILGGLYLETWVERSILRIHHDNPVPDWQVNGLLLAWGTFAITTSLLLMVCDLLLQYRKKSYSLRWSVIAALEKIPVLWRFGLWLSRGKEDHPEGFDHACECPLCCSYGEG